MGKYKRGRQARWDRRNLVTVSTHVSRETAAAFRKACSAAGATPYSTLRKFVENFHAGTAIREQMFQKEVHNE